MSSKKSRGASKDSDHGLDLLVIGAHPDDAELVAGGTIAKATKGGRRVGILDATRGETGTRGTAAGRAREAERAARILGVALRENLGLRDGYLSVEDDARRALVERIRALRPRVVIAPHWESRHPDHRALSSLVRDACFLAGLSRWRADGSPWRPSRVLYAVAYLDVRPTFYVDVSDEFDVKLRAIQAHRSQVAGARRLGDIPETGRPLLETIRVFGAYYGALIRTKFAEPFLGAHAFEKKDIAEA